MYSCQLFNSLSLFVIYLLCPLFVFCRSFILFMFDYLFPCCLFSFLINSLFYLLKTTTLILSLCSGTLIPLYLFKYTCIPSSIRVNKHHTADSTGFVLVQERRTYYHNRHSGMDETNISTQQTVAEGETVIVITLRYVFVFLYNILTLWRNVIASISYSSEHIGAVISSYSYHAKLIDERYRFYQYHFSLFGSAFQLLQFLCVQKYCIGQILSFFDA